MTTRDQFVMLVQTAAPEWIINQWIDQLQSKKWDWPGWNVATQILGDAMRVTEEELPDPPRLAIAALAFTKFRVAAFTQDSSSSQRATESTPPDWLKTEF